MIKKRLLIGLIVIGLISMTSCDNRDVGIDSVESLELAEATDGLVLVEEQLEASEASELASESPVSISSEVDEGYYGDTYQLSGDHLKAVLNDIITEGHGALSYDQVYSALEDTDEDLDDPSKVVLFYKDVLVSDNYLRMSDDGDIWNREHIWAKSHGDFGTYRGPGTDLHMIRPTDASVNGRRGHLDFDESDHPFDEVDGIFVDEDSFEPRDEVKGDVARMLFYMAVRYEGEDGEVDLELSDRTGTYYETKSGYGEHGKLSTLLAWHELDPVDEFEEVRNERIYKIQGNRNPFIDYPEFVAMIWGGTESTQVLGDNQDHESMDQALGLSTIEELRYMESGSTATISGIVTFIENDTTIYIQEDLVGIRVDSHGSDISLDHYLVGQRLIITGQVTTFKGEKELRVKSLDQVIELDNEAKPSPVTTTLLALSEGELQGVLVTLDNLSVVWKNNQVFEVEDDQGYRMKVYMSEGSGVSQGDLIIGSQLGLIGIPSWYDDLQIKVVEVIEKER